MTLLYQPPPLDAAGLRILRAMRELGFSTWHAVGRMPTINMRAIGVGLSPLLGYLETRQLRRYGGRGVGVRRSEFEFEARITGVGLAECDRTDA